MWSLLFLNEHKYLIQTLIMVLELWQRKFQKHLHSNSLKTQIKIGFLSLASSLKSLKCEEWRLLWAPVEWNP